MSDGPIVPKRALPPHLAQYQWKPGVSGHQGYKGDRSLSIRVRDLARQYTEEAVMALVDALKGRDRVPAAIALLDRGWGKPPQAVTGEDGEGPVIVTYRWLKAGD